jgi:molybdopterin molybdotransferase
MISTKEALDFILDSTPAGKMETICIEDALDRVLAEDIFASRSYPPFDRVTMDGIAISSLANAKEFKVQSITKAGEKTQKLSQTDSCIEVMTGCPLPSGCDTIIPYEEVEIKNKIAKIINPSYEYKNFIHDKASDYKKDDLLIKKNTPITSAVLGIIASQGIRKVKVYALPRISIISSGNEIKELGEQIQEHEIYRSNPYMLERELKGLAKFEINKFHTEDNLEETIKTLAKALDQSDLIIVCGGVSKGKFDYIPAALEKLEVKKIFHRVSQRPGKPLYYGTKGEKQIFGLPGNPVSALVCLRKYVISSVEKQMGLAALQINGILTKSIEFKNDLTYFVAVSASFDPNGRLLLTPIETNTSGDFNSLCHSSGIIELPKDRHIFSPGESFLYYPWN